MKNSFVNGFTLMELLVTLGLIGLVLIIGQAVFGIVALEQDRFQKNLDQMSEHLILENQLYRDARSAWSWDFVSSQSLKIKNQSGNLIAHYQFLDTKTIRNEDTFDVAYIQVLQEPPGKLILYDEDSIPASFRIPSHASLLDKISKQSHENSN